MENNSYKVAEFIIALAYIFLPLIVGWIHISQRKFKKGGILTLFLSYYVFISVGLQGIITGLLQMLKPELVSAFTQWNYSPFLIELGMANFSFGILGIVTVFLHRNEKLAAAFGYGLFLLLTGVGHIKNIVSYGFLPGDSGGFLISDIFVGSILLLLSILNFFYPNRTHH